MPIFEYLCPECGTVEEKLVKSAAVKPPACSKCGHKKTEKQFSTFSAVVKSAPQPAPAKCQGCPNTGCPSFGV